MQAPQDGSVVHGRLRHSAVHPLHCRSLLAGFLQTDDMLESLREPRTAFAAHRRGAFELPVPALGASSGLDFTRLEPSSVRVDHRPTGHVIQRAASFLFLNDSSSDTRYPEDYVHFRSQMLRNRHDIHKQLLSLHSLQHAGIQYSSFNLGDEEKEAAKNAIKEVAAKAKHAQEKAAPKSTINEDAAQHAQEKAAPKSTIKEDAAQHAQVKAAPKSAIKEVALHPERLTDVHEVIKVGTEVATVCNYGALLLTLVAALYHAYGYIQYRNAKAQEQDGAQHQTH